MLANTDSLEHSPNSFPIILENGYIHNVSTVQQYHNA